MTDQNTIFHFNSRFSGGNILHDLENYIMHIYVGIHWIIVLYQWLLVVVYLHVLVVKGSFDLCELYMIYWGCFGRWYFSRHYVAGSFLYKLQCLVFVFPNYWQNTHDLPHGSYQNMYLSANVWCVAASSPMFKQMKSGDCQVHGFPKKFHGVFCNLLLA